MFAEWHLQGKSCGLLFSKETVISRCPHKALALDMSLLRLPGASCSWQHSRCAAVCRDCPEAGGRRRFASNLWAKYLLEGTWSSVFQCETCISGNLPRTDESFWSINAPTLKWCSGFDSAERRPTHSSQASQDHTPGLSRDRCDLGHPSALDHLTVLIIFQTQLFSITSNSEHSKRKFNLS